MRIRNLNPKPTTFTGNPLMFARWKTTYRNGDGCFTVNTGNNASIKPSKDETEFPRAKTSFDIIGNPDIQVQPTDVAPWITGLPDGQVYFLCDVEPLQDINVMMQAYGQIDKNKNFNVSPGIVEASGVTGSQIVVSAVCRHQLDNRNCATVRFTSDAEPNTDVARVWGVAIVTGEEKEIMDLLDVGAFTALTAPYAAVLAGGGVFLLALVVLTGGRPHENQEPASGRARCQASLNMEPVGQAGRKRPCDVHKQHVRLGDFSGLQKYEAGRHVLPAPNKRIRLLRDFVASPAGRIVCRYLYSAEQKRRVGAYGRVLYGDRILHRRASGIQRPAISRNRMLHRRHRTLLNGLGVAA